MKKALKALTFLLIAAILMTAIPLVSSAKSSALAGKTIVTFGDSLTKLGTSASTVHYSDYLASDAYLGVPIINMGVGGDSTRHGMARFETDVLSKNPDLVIICFGMNDQAGVLASGTPNVPLETYRQNLTYFVEQLQAIGSDVVFMTPNPVLQAPGYYTPGDYGLDYNYGFLGEFCNAMREVAIEYECTLVDINYECEFEDLYKFISDGIHQTTYGKQQYAKYISEHLLAVYDGIDKATMTVNCVDTEGNVLKTVTHVGKAGAHITLASPEIYGYETAEEDIKATFVDGKAFTFTYDFKLKSLLQDAKASSFDGYSDIIIDKIRESVKLGEELLSNEASELNDIFSCTDELELCLSINGNAQYVQSLGATCTDVKLTDGVKGTADGGAKNYVSFLDKTATILLDLGSEKSVNYFSVYTASGMNNASKPAKLTVLVSNDNESYEEIASQTAVKTTINTDKWDTKIITAVTDTPVSARYVKFVLESSNELLLVDEVEASLSVSPIKPAVSIDAINVLPKNGQTAIFTKGEIKGDLNGLLGVLAEKNGEGFKVVSTSDSLESTVLSNGQIFLVTDIASSKLSKLSVGDEIIVSGIDFAKAELGVMPYAKLDIEITEDAVDGNMFWVTHFNTNTVEGAGVIFTNEYSGCAWWLNIAFAPVVGHEGVYEIVAKSDGAGDGSGKPVAIPEGGFAYGINTGNDYITINKDPEALNFKSANASTALTAARKWKIGDRFVLGNIDFETKEIPTTTAYIDYFAPEYVCTATIATYVPKYKLGDVNDNGEVEKYDYILVKRAYLKTLTLDETQQKAADVNVNGGLDVYDYILVKRHVLGTYEIKG